MKESSEETSTKDCRELSKERNMADSTCKNRRASARRLNMTGGIIIDTEEPLPRRTQRRSTMEHKTMESPHKKKPRSRSMDSKQQQQHQQMLALMLGIIMSITILQPTNAIKVSANLDDPNLPWETFKNTLSSAASLIKATPQDYIDQCSPEFLKDPFNRSNDVLEGQPSGVCMDQLACGFENCVPFASAELPEEPATWLVPGNPRFNIPNAVLFPAVANDIVAAVKFATRHNLELSVKNSGHNHAGASTKKDTLLVNMRRNYRDYSPTGIVECNNSNNVEQPPIEKDLRNQPCNLALARNKTAYVRVGGGENWGDVYKSVKAFNEKLTDGYKYLIVGGAQPSVTPMGWTFQGGLGGTAAGRLYGFGVDQILMVEAVLPNGWHVRFGPTAWQDDLYPKTTAVTGVCNTNPEGDEEEWFWTSCPVDGSDEAIDFDELWFAFCGGGGGTWGVVTSIYLQLHDYLPLEKVDFYPFTLPALPEVTAAVGLSEKAFNSVKHDLAKFILDFLLDPVSVGVSEAESNACGTPQIGHGLYCYGEGSAGVFVSALEERLSSTIQQEDIDTSENATQVLGITSAILDAATTMHKDFIGTDPTLAFPGVYLKGFDAWAPGSPSILIPLSFYQKQKEAFYSWTESLGYFVNGNLPFMYFGYGGNMATAHDQASSLSQASRDAGIMMFSVPNNQFVMETLYGIGSDDTTIPAFLGGNHFDGTEYGPLKTDPTKPCDTVDSSEANQRCFSTQAAVWGSENLARLEAIKKKIDPNGIFNCNKCVGNNYISDATTSTSTSEVDNIHHHPPEDKENDAPAAGDENAIDSNADNASTTSSSGGFRWIHTTFVLAMIVVTPWLIVST